MSSNKVVHINTRKKGFASMDEEEQREIASKDEKGLGKKGAANAFDFNDANETGKKSGKSKSRTVRNSRTSSQSHKK
jgi:uncharacterized protein